MTSPATAHTCPEPWITMHIGAQTHVEPASAIVARFASDSAVADAVQRAITDLSIEHLTKEGVRPWATFTRSLRLSNDAEIARALPDFIKRGQHQQHPMPMPKPATNLHTVRTLATAIAAFGPVYSSDDETLTPAQADRLHALCELLLPAGGERNAIKLAHAIHAATDLELFYHVVRFEWAYFTKVDDVLCTRMAAELGCPSSNSHVHGCIGRLCRIVLVDMMTSAL